MSLADRIREAMGTRAPGEFAKSMHVTPASVTFWLDGTTKSLRGEMATRMEQVTGYRASWIVTGKGPKKTTDAGESPSEAWPFSTELRLRISAMEAPDIHSLEVAMWVNLREPIPGRLLREYQARPAHEQFVFDPGAAREKKEMQIVGGSLGVPGLPATAGKKSKASK